MPPQRPTRAPAGARWPLHESLGWDVKSAPVGAQTCSVSRARSSRRLCGSHTCRSYNNRVANVNVGFFVVVVVVVFIYLLNFGACEQTAASAPCCRSIVQQQNTDTSSPSAEGTSAKGPAKALAQLIVFFLCAQALGRRSRAVSYQIGQMIILGDRNTVLTSLVCSKDSLRICCPDCSQTLKKSCGFVL